jgi:outer membrane protein TolC
LFQSGQTSLTEVNLAQREKDLANSNLIKAIRQFWVAHYLLRRAALYDFERLQAIE